jgi:2-(1,2-epoxy-1,2-dihydrophenyl)acetyl-CoA isomerase
VRETVSDTLLYTVDAGIATVTLNRPQVMNALDAGMIVQLRAVCEKARDDKAVRAVVLRGNGPAFLAGGDVALFHANLPRLPELVRELAGELHHAIIALREAAKPVVASVHGAVAGAGVSLLAAADLAIAAADTKFTLAYSKIATSPDGGSTYFLPRIVGTRKALELMMLSDTFDADAALASGLVNWVVASADLAAATARLAQRLANGPTLAYGETKALVNRTFERPLAAQLDAEAQAFARCAGTRDLAEGVTAFVEKRSPRFRGE